MKILRHILPILMLWCSAMSGFANDFIELPATAYPIKENLPVFYTQIELNNALGNATTFKLEYPEYLALTSKETERIKKLGLTAPENIELHFSIATSRKVRYADISFCPIVCRDGKWMRLVSAKISPITPSGTKAARSANEESNRYAENSILRQGKWLKIKVVKEGIYELTASALAQHGFHDLNRVKIYGYGGRILPMAITFNGIDALTDDLEEVATLKRSNSIVFFAEGTLRWTYNNKWTHEQNTYSDASYYFVTEGDNPLRIGSQTATSTPASTLTSITHNVLCDNDAFGWYFGGNRLYDSFEFKNGTSNTYKLSTPDPANANANVQIAFSAASATAASRATVSLSGTNLGTMVMPILGSNESAREVIATYNVSNLRSDNSFRFDVTTAGSARLNFIQISYNRALRASGDAYSFTPNTSSKVALSIAGASSSTQLWRIAYAGNPTTQMQGTLNGSTLNIPLDNGKLRYVIVNTAKSYPAPEIVETIGNQNLHADKNIDMVIIIPESGILAGEAERLANVHRQKQGLRVKVVTANQIYNEFSSGTPDATAYRRYMKMLYDRAENINDAPRYLLLFGNCAWDNRMITEEWKNYNPKDFLLCFENCEKINDYTFSIGALYSYVSDDYFGLLDDGEGININREKIDLGIGRFPVHSAENAKILVDKTIAYMDNKEVGLWKNTVCALGDNGDANEHMEDAEKAVAAIESASGKRIDVQRLYWDAYPRSLSATGYSFPEAKARLKEIIKSGAVMFNYSGHGSPDQLSNSKMLTTEELRALSHSKMPMWVMVSCEISPFDEMRDDIGRATLINPNGGAIALFCSARAVYASYNSRINAALCTEIFGHDKTSGKRNSMGDAVRKAKSSMIYDASNPSSNIDHTMNKLKFALLGDPAVTLSIPTGNVVIDSINGKAVSAELLEQLPAGSKAIFSGHIENCGESSADASFTGLLTATLYDRAETVTCKNNDGSADKPMTYSAHSNAVAVSTDSIKNGYFRITLPVPVDISYSTDAGRLSLYAVNTDHSVEGNGYCNAFCLKGTSPNILTDKAGPEVDIYLNDPTFPSGGTVGTSALFVASIYDESGINAPLQNVGHDMELVIDEDASMYYVINQHFSYDFGSITSGTLTYQLDNLPLGKHTLTFRVWDTAGNSTTKELDFNVNADYTSSIINITATKSPASSSTRFIASFDSLTVGSSATFEVYDFTGTCVWSKTCTSDYDARYFSTEWDLTNNSGTRVPGGIYMYRAILHSNEGNAKTKTKKIIVIKQ